MSSADIAACFPSEHDSLLKPIALGLNVSTVKVMNWVFILIILVLGLGLGGWASIKTMDEKVKEFELFDRCNGC